jgi:PhzF family phenazine biosynthesis protein
MRIRTFIVDAFTRDSFKGNPAGVCLLDTQLDAPTMQSIASELNLSETAFLLETGTNAFAVRYFTPTVEIPFCGHATLAASKIVFEYEKLTEVSFMTFYNLHLSAKKEDDSIAMKFPLYDTVAYEVPEDLLDALGIEHALSTRFNHDLKMVLIEVEDNTALLAVKPNFTKALLVTDKLNNAIVTARSNDNVYDFYSRCFCPWIGINEDPVTGAAHTILAKYWGDILAKSEMKAYQSSLRGGYLHLKIISQTELEVRSDAKIMLEGVMEI